MLREGEWPRGKRHDAWDHRHRERKGATSKNDRFYWGSASRKRLAAKKQRHSQSDPQARLNDLEERDIREVAGSAGGQFNQPLPATPGDPLTDVGNRSLSSRKAPLKTPHNSTPASHPPNGKPHAIQACQPRPVPDCGASEDICLKSPSAFAIPKEGAMTIALPGRIFRGRAFRQKRIFFWWRRVRRLLTMGSI